MKRMALLAVTAGLLVAPAGVAQAPPVMPCGDWTLRATHAASAESYDFNGDRAECWGDGGRDNEANLPAGSYFEGVKFYSWGDRRTGITSVNTRQRTISGWLLGQEDDPDLNGCSGRCRQKLTYDANDLYYVDYGAGSTLATMVQFERAAKGARRLTIIYNPDPAGTSLYSLELA